MTKPRHQSSEAPVSAKRPGVMLGLAAIALIWERLWPRLWPVCAVVLLFLSVALLDVLPLLPKAIHWLVLLGFAAAFVIRFRHLLTGNYKITSGQSRARLERDSELVHQPLRALEDKPVGRDALGVELWEVHQRRMAAALAALQVKPPSPKLSMRDPFALRMMVVLISAVAFGAGAHNFSERLSRAIVPPTEMISHAGLKLDVWVTPPAYTGLAPVFLETPEVGTNASPEIIQIPVGSIILAQVTGEIGVAEIAVPGRRIPLDAINETEDDGGYRGETEIVDTDQQGDKLAIFVDQQKAAEWPIKIIIDQPPLVEFVDPPKKSGQANLALRFEARDDFALKQIWATIRNTKGQNIPGGGDHIRLELPALGLGTPLGKGRSTHDLSAHPWAGTEVEVRLFALDAKDQEGKSEGFKMILPSRVFNHPVARALVEARKQLNTPDEATVLGVIDALDQIKSNPARFFHDTTVFLNIAVARSRLAHDRGEDAIPSVQKQLWETALRIEDGEFAVADKELRDIQEQLSQAMREGASAQELDRLMDQLQAALDKYLAALAEHLERQGASEMPANPLTRSVESGDLQRMIEQTRNLAKTGAMEAAQQMLAQLNRMLDGIREGARTAPQNSQMGKARKMMNDLRGLARRQQQLLDQTFREMQNQESKQPLPRMGNGAMPPTKQGEGGGKPSNGGKPSDQAAGKGQKPGNGPLRGMSDAQAKLRSELGRLMLQMDEILGSIPQGLGKAERAMKGAGKSLNKGDAAGAVPQQTDALEQLRKGTNSASEQLARQMQGRAGMAPGMPGQRQGPGQGRDPFGRPGGGAFGAMADDGNVKVPSERDMIRAREILDELHRRAGEHVRPQPERDYIDRILRRF